MKKGRKKIFRLLFVAVALFCSVVAIAGTVTFSKYYEDYNNRTEEVTVATPVARIVVNEITRKEKDKPGKIAVNFNQDDDSIMLNDVEPEDEIEYYFTVSGIDENAVNQVTMNVTISIEVRLETIASQNDPNEVGGSTTSGVRNIDYFAGWKTYNNQDGVKDGGYLKVYHGSKSETARDIRPTAQSNTRNDQDGRSIADFTGNTLTIDEKENGKIVNIVGLVMRADDAKKDYSYHLVFTLPKQNADTESYASARLYIDINTIAEQAKQV